MVYGQNFRSLPTIISTLLWASLILTFISLDNFPSASTANGSLPVIIISSNGKMLGSSYLYPHQPLFVNGRLKASSFPSCGCTTRCSLSFLSLFQKNGWRLQTITSIL